MSDELQTGLSEEDILEKTKWFKGTIPREIIELYEWHNGQIGNEWELSYPFLFRDYAFSSIEVSKRIYKDLIPDWVNTGLFEGRFDLYKCFPIAEFNGTCLVLSDNVMKFDTGESRPIVSLSEDAGVYFYSFERMLDACIEWAKRGSFEEHFQPPDNELEIWRKFNPGIFS